MKLIRGFMLAAIAITAAAAFSAHAISPPWPEPSSVILAVVMVVGAWGLAAVCLAMVVMAVVSERIGDLRRDQAARSRREPDSRRNRSVQPRASPASYLIPT